MPTNAKKKTFKETFKKVITKRSLPFRVYDLWDNYMWWEKST